MNQEKHSLLSKDIQELNDRHIRNVDKFMRMYSGLASNIEHYRENMWLQIKVVNTEKRLPSNEETARNIVSAWMKFNVELRTVRVCEVDFYKTNKPTGFTFSLQELDKEKITQITREMEIEEKLAYVSTFLIIPMKQFGIKY